MKRRHHEIGKATKALWMYSMARVLKLNQSPKSNLWLLRAAMQGHAGAQENLARNSNKNTRAAKHWAHKSAVQGNAKGQFLYGYLHRDTDPQEALEWIKKSAAQGIVKAQSHLAELYMVEKKFNQCLFWAKKAAAQQSVIGLDLMGLWYSKSKQRDFALAKQYFEKAIALGGTNSLCHLAQLYFNFDDHHDETKFFILCQTAAMKGNKMGKFYLGRCYDKGIGVTQDSKEAHRWVTLAADDGYGQAFAWLGDAEITNKNQKGALELFEKGVKLDDPSCQTHLACLLFQQKDLIRSKSLFQKAIAQHHPPAMYNAALNSSLPDSERVALMSRSAKLGCVEAQLILGGWYRYAVCMNATNQELAFKWHHKVASIKNPYQNPAIQTQACYLVSLYYQRGEGVDIDFDKSIEWCRKAGGSKLQIEMIQHEQKIWNETIAPSIKKAIKDRKVKFCALTSKLVSRQGKTAHLAPLQHIVPEMLVSSPTMDQVKSFHPPQAKPCLQCFCGWYTLHINSEDNYTQQCHICKHIIQYHWTYKG